MNAIIFDWIGTLYERDKGPFSFAKGTLEKLEEKYNLGLVSKYGEGPLDEIRRKNEMHNSGLEKYFTSIIVAPEKTEYQFYKAMEPLFTSEPETIVVGDRASREILIGHEMGCKTYWISEGDRSFDSPEKIEITPTGIIKSIKDLEEILL